MAGVYLFIARADPKRAARGVRSLSYYDDEDSQIVVCDRFTCIWSGVNDKALCSVTRDLGLGRMVLVQTRRQQEPDIALGEQVARFPAGARGQVGVLGHRESERMGVEKGRLLGVAHVEAEVIDVDQPQRVGVGVVFR